MTTPIPAEDLPKALAEAIGWSMVFGYTEIGGGKPPKYILNNQQEFQPHLSHDHAQLVISEIKKRNLGYEYMQQCHHIYMNTVSTEYNPFDWFVANMTPEERTRAALAALTGK
jgi:hypothetical protein